MSNIVWKQPNNTLAVTSIFDNSSPQDYAIMLKYRGDMPADWEAVAFNWQQFPAEIQESWRWDGAKIVIDADALRRAKYLRPVSALQLRSALNQLNLRDSFEQAVTSGNQDLKDVWALAPKFNRFDSQILDIQTASNLTEAEIDKIFDLAKVL